MTPIAATQRIEAAVVSPSVCPSSARQMMPTPRNPIPVATPATACPAVTGNIVNARPEMPAAPRATIANVRSPALLPRCSRSSPDQEAEQRSESHPRRQRELERDATVLEEPHGAQA